MFQKILVKYIPIKYKVFLFKKKLFCTVIEVSLFDDLIFFLQTDLNVLKEKYLIPYFKGRLEIAKGLDRNFNQLIYKVLILDIDASFIELFNVTFDKLPKYEQEILSLCIKYLFSFYGIKISTYLVDIHIKPRFIPVIEKYKLLHRNYLLLSKGDYRLHKIFYYIFNHNEYVFNLVLKAEVEFIRNIIYSNEKLVFKNDMDVISFLSCRKRDQPKGKYTVKPSKQALFTMEQEKIGGSEKQFNLFYEVTEISKVKAFLADYKAFTKLFLQNTDIITGRDISYISLIKNNNLRKSVFISVFYQKYFNPRIIFSSMHFCGFSNLIASSIIENINIYQYVRVGNRLPQQETTKYFYIDKIYDLYKNSFSIIVNSMHLYKEYKSTLPTNDIVQIYNVVNKPYVKNDNKKSFKFGFVGRDVPSKRILSLIDVLAEIKSKSGKQIELLIFSDEFTCEVRKKVQEKELFGYVRLIENETNLDIIYHSFDIYITISELEGLSNSLMEAMAYGLPCITLNIGGSNEIVINGVNGYICDSLEEVVSCSLLLIQNHVLFLNIKKNALETDLSKFDISQLEVAISHEIKKRVF